jgi:hypothetical protein
LFAVSRKQPRRRVVLVFLGCLVALGYFMRVPRNPNENSRMAPVLALLWHGSLAIDAYHRVGPVRTTDESFHAGHYYSDKAPGSSMLAALGYLPVYGWERATGREAPYVVRKYVMTLAADGLPVAVMLCVLFVLVSSVAGPRAGAAITAAGLLATPLLPFGSALFGHALAGALLFLAFALLRRLVGNPSPPRWSALAGAGALLGLAIATEYTTAPAALLVAAYGLFRLGQQGDLPRVRTWIGPLLGIAPFGLAVALYNLSCFGSPFSLGYENLASTFYRSFHARGLVGVGLPRPDVAYYLTLHPARGLFVEAPVLLLALPGLWFMFRRSGWRAEAALCSGVFLSFLIVNSGFGLWWGGYTYIARHLVPSVPFLLLPLGFLPRVWWWAGVPLFAASAAQTLVAAFGDPFCNDAFLFDRLRELERTRGGLVPWRGSWSVRWDIWPAFRSRSTTGAWIGFSLNAGRLLRLAGPASMVPMLASVAALFTWAANARRLPLGGRPERDGFSPPGTPAGRSSVYPSTGSVPPGAPATRE